MISQIIEQWKGDTENIYKNKDLIKFIKPLLEYVLEKNDEKQQIIYEFISSRKNFTNDRPSTIIINYMEKTFNEKNEIILKKKSSSLFPPMAKLKCICLKYHHM